MKIVLLFLMAALSATNAQNVQGLFACEGSSITMTCGKGEYLEIVGGNFGRKNVNICRNTKNNNCVSGWSLWHMKDKCNDRQTCTLWASTSEMGDPCPYVKKYLETYYRCIKDVQCSDSQYKCKNKVCIAKSQVCDGFKNCPGGEDEAGCKYASATACQKNRLTISCKPGEIIRIVRGFYGRSSKTTCGTSTITNCSSSKADEVIRNKCNFQQSCTIIADTNEFGDPCVGVNKYAEAQYSCWTVPKMLSHYFN